MQNNHIQGPASCDLHLLDACIIFANTDVAVFLCTRAPHVYLVHNGMLRAFQGHELGDSPIVGVLDTHAQRI